MFSSRAIASSAAMLQRSTAVVTRRTKATWATQGIWPSASMAGKEGKVASSDSLYKNVRCCCSIRCYPLRFDCSSRSNMLTWLLLTAFYFVLD